MGTLRVPPSGSVYLDANSVIYSVERHPAFAPLLLPLWQAAQSKSIEIISSERTLMETLVGAFKSQNAALIHAYEQIFQQPQTRLLPITRAILREAAQLRVTTKLKTPDAVHRFIGSVLLPP